MRGLLPAMLLAAALAPAACGDSATSSVAPRPSAPPPDATGFVDRTDWSGIDFVNHTGSPRTKDFIVEVKGGGSLVLDYDGDGDLDLYAIDGNTIEVDGKGAVVSRTTHPDAGNRLYRNDGGWRFTDVTVAAGTGDRSYGVGGAVGDVDGDGRPDIYVCNWGKNVLYRNRGDGTFEDVTARAGVSGADRDMSTGATFLDADRDGDLDLYCANYNDIGEFILRCGGVGRMGRFAGMPVPFGPRGIDPLPDRFFRNEGDGTFTEATESALTDQVPRYGFTPVAADFDGDGDLDIYVANDLCPNTLWVNDGTGRFTDRAHEAGVALDAGGAEQAGMGCDAADYDQDGWIDLFVTNFSQDKNTLYRNLTAETGRLFLEDVTERAGLVRVDYNKVCWGTAIADLNQDGWLDIFVAAGHVYAEADLTISTTGEPHRQLPTLWYGSGPPGWTFRSMAGRVGGPGLHIPKVGRGASFADFDDDGDLDVYLAALNERPLLLENRLPDRGNWLMLDLVGKGRDTDAIGARATVRAGEIRQVKEKRRNASFLSSNDPRLHWGLGGNGKVESLSVRWLDGRTQVFTDLEANHLYRLVQGGELERVR